MGNKVGVGAGMGNMEEEGGGGGGRVKDENEGNCALSSGMGVGFRESIFGNDDGNIGGGDGETAQESANL